MTEEGPQIKSVLIQRGKAVARIEQKIDELATFRSVSAGMGSFWNDSRIIVSVVSISVGREQEITKYFGVRLHSNGLRDYFRYCECYLDFDEIDEFLSGIELVKSSMKKMHEPSPESKQVYYSSKDDIHVGFYQAQGSSMQMAYLCIEGGNGEMFRFRIEEEDGETEEDEVYSESAEESLARDAVLDFDHLISTIHKGQELIRQWMESPR